MTYSNETRVRTTVTTRNDAVNHVESLLGSEGSRELAEIMVEMVGWRVVAENPDNIDDFDSYLEMALDIYSMRRGES